MSDVRAGALAHNPTVHGSTCYEAHAFIEDRDLDSLSSYVRVSSHVKYTCVTASKHLLCLGTSNGMVVVFQRDSSLRQQSLVRAAPSNALTAVCAVTLLRISPDEKRIAASRSDGGVSIIDLNPLLKALPSVTDLSGRRKRRVTDMVWNAAGNMLLIGDDEGLVHSHNSSLGAIFNNVVELLRVDSLVVQLDCFGENLLISTLTRCYIFNLSSKVKTVIGKQPRNGHFGACFLRLPDVDTPSIYCARRRGRLWEADFSGNVLNTHELQEERALPAATVLSYRSLQQGDGASSSSPCDVTISSERRTTTASGLTLGRLFSLSSSCLLSHSESHVCIVNPISAALILWTDFFKGATDVFCFDEDIYLINSQGDQLKEIHFSSLSLYLERSVSVVQPPVSCIDSGGVRAILCCRLCLDQSVLVKDMLEAGRLQPALLVALCRAVEQVTLQDGNRASMMAEFRDTFGKWIGEETNGCPSANDCGPLQPKQGALAGVAIEDAIEANVTLRRTVSTDSLSADDNLMETGARDGVSSFRAVQTELHHDSPFSDDISFDRLSFADSTARSDTDPEVQSIVSYPGSELSHEANSDQQSVHITENAEASPPRITSNGTVLVGIRRLLPNAGKSPIESLLAATDRIKSAFGSKMKRVIPVGSRGRSASSSTDMEQSGIAAAEEVAWTIGIADPNVVSFSQPQPPAGSFGQQQQQHRIAQLRLLEQTHRVWSALRSVCGASSFLSPGCAPPGCPGGDDGQRQRELLVEQLASWCDSLIDVRSVAVAPSASKAAAVATRVAVVGSNAGESDTENDTAALLSAVMHASASAVNKEQLPPWRLQPVNVTWPVTLTDEDRRILTSVAMLYLELGCRPPVRNDGCRDRGDRLNHDASDMPAAELVSFGDGSFSAAPSNVSHTAVPREEGIHDVSIGVGHRVPMGAAELAAVTSGVAELAQPCSLCHELSCTFSVVRTCWFMRSFFALLDVKRLAAWLASLRCGLECWKCFVSCLEEAESHQDQGTAVLQASAGGEPLSADEVLRGVLNLAKSYVAPVSARASILSSDVIAARVYLTASRLFLRYPEKVVSFCTELRHFIQAPHVRYMIETTDVGLRYYVAYMDRIMQSLNSDAARNAFIHDQCQTPATGQYWLQCLLSSDSAVLSESVHCRCCRMIRPTTLSLAWPHKGLIDNILATFVRQNALGASGPLITSFVTSDSAASDRNSRLNKLVSVLKDYGYWSGYIYLSARMHQTEEVWKCLLQNGDFDAFQQETCAEGVCLTLDEWPRVLQLRQRQDARDVSLASGCQSQEDRRSTGRNGCSAANSNVIEVITSGNVEHCSPHHTPSSSPIAKDFRTCDFQQHTLAAAADDDEQVVMASSGQQGQADKGESSALENGPSMAVCLFCGSRLESMQTVPWDHLLLLFVKRHGFSRMWPLLQQASVPHETRTLFFYKLCLQAARTEIQQKESSEKILEVMNSYLWSKRPDYATPEIRFRIEHQQSLTSIRLPKAALTAGRHTSALSRGMPRLLLDDPSCRWGAPLFRARCPFCNKSIVDNPSTSGDGGASIFDCGMLLVVCCKTKFSWIEIARINDLIGNAIHSFQVTCAIVIVLLMTEAVHFVSQPARQLRCLVRNPSDDRCIHATAAVQACDAKLRSLGPLRLHSLAPALVRLREDKLP